MSVVLAACSSEEEPLGSAVEDNPCGIPLETPESLLGWLRDGSYEEWSVESSIHDSTGPHFGNVRSWINAEVEGSLEAENESHPLCSATVKELYGDGDSRRGWAVSVKVANNGDRSDWYWFEEYDDETIAAGVDVNLCIGCHEVGSDYVLTPFPLQ